MIEARLGRQLRLRQPGCVCSHLATRDDIGIGPLTYLLPKTQINPRETSRSLLSVPVALQFTLGFVRIRNSHGVTFEIECLLSPHLPIQLAESECLAGPT